MKQVKITFDGQYNTRNIASSPSTSSGYIGIGVIGIMVIGKGNQGSGKDVFYYNCFSTTVTDLNGRKKRYLVKRPGFETNSTPSSGNVGEEIMIWTGNSNKIISAFGSTNSTIYDGTTSLGAITGRCTGLTETQISNVATLCITSSDNTAWTTTSTAVSGALTFTGDTHTNTTVDNVSSTSGLVVGQLLTGTGFAANTRIASIDSATAITLTLATTATNAGVTITRTILGKIVDADFPGNASKTLAGTFVHMDGYAVIMCSDGTVWASDLNTVTAWTATSFDTASAHPDSGIGLARHKNFIIAFGQNSMEFYYNAGLTPFPFAKSISMTTKLGAINYDSIARISDVNFFCGTSPEGGIGVFKFEGGIQKISTPEIDTSLIYSGTTQIYMTTIRFFGRSFVLVNTATNTYAYCVEENMWFQFTSQQILWSKCVGLPSGSSMTNYSISRLSTSGKIYKMDHASLVFTDDAYAYSASAHTSNDNLGTNKRKFWSSIEVIGDTETSTSNITLSYSDDDYQTFTIYGDLDLSSDRPRATRLGSSRSRVWGISHSANTPMRIEHLEAEIEVGQ